MGEEGLPIEVEPVNVIASTSMWRPSDRPAFAGSRHDVEDAVRKTRLQASSASLIAASEDCSAGFSTIEFPAASAERPCRSASSGEVPGRDGPDHSLGSRTDMPSDFASVGNRISVNLVHRFGEEGELATGGINFTDRVGDRFAHFSEINRPISPRSAWIRSTSSWSTRLRTRDELRTTGPTRTTCAPR